MAAHPLDDGDLGAVVRAGFSSSKPLPAAAAAASHPSYLSPAATTSTPAASLLPAAPAPRLPSASPLTSALGGGAAGLSCLENLSGFGLPALSDLVKASCVGPHDRFSALSQTLPAIDRLPSPSSLPRFDYTAHTPTIFPMPVVHPPAVRELDMGPASAFASRHAGPGAHLPSAADAALMHAKGRLNAQSFLQQIVCESPRLVGHSSANRLSDIIALNRNVGAVSAGLGQHTGALAALDQFKNMVEGEPSSLSAEARAPYKERGMKKRKALQKRVVCIPAPSAVSSRPGAGENVPSDLWAWRKYGQKPIKGSPHPRGYYRCSSSKGCPARKQVERNPSDPSMLVITYTSDHNHAWPTHRINALAGSTRAPLSAATTSSQEKSPSSNNEMSPDCATNDMEDELHSDDLGEDALTEEAQVESPTESKVSSTLSQQEEPAMGGAASCCGGDEVGQATIGMPSSCAEDDPYLQESIFAEMLEEMQRQNRCHMVEEVVEEGISVEVDPFNLFNWSSCPNNESSSNKVNDVAQ